MSSRSLPLRVKFTNGLIFVREVENIEFQLNYIAANGLTMNFKDSTGCVIVRDLVRTKA